MFRLKFHSSIGLILRVTSMYKGHIHKTGIVLSSQFPIHCVYFYLACDILCIIYFKIYEIVLHKFYSSVYCVIITG
jgi:hypothetical protein